MAHPAAMSNDRLGPVAEVHARAVQRSLSWFKSRLGLQLPLVWGLQLPRTINVVDRLPSRRRLRSDNVLAMASKSAFGPKSRNRVERRNDANVTYGLAAMRRVTTQRGRAPVTGPAAWFVRFAGVNSIVCPWDSAVSRFPRS